jgi:hypothetical protein
MNKEAASKFINVLFLSRTIAHQMHLATESYSQHAGALGPFYEEIVGLTDGLAEQWQGEFEELLKLSPLGSKETDPLKYFKDTKKWIQDNRKEAFGDDSALQNDVDEIVKLFRSTIYKLRFLK